MPPTESLVSAIDLDGTTAGEQRQKLNSLSSLVVEDAAAVASDSTDSMTIDNADFDLGSGNLAVRVDSIEIRGQIQTRGDATVKLVARRNIRLNESSRIQSVEGDVSLIANMGENRRLGDFHGLLMSGATISSHQGDITLRGRGGDDVERVNQDGVRCGGCVQRFG